MTVNVKLLEELPFSHKWLTDVLWCVTIGLDEAHVRFIAAPNLQERKNCLRHYRELLQFGYKLLHGWGLHWFRDEDLNEFAESLNRRAVTYKARALEVGNNAIRKEMLVEVKKIEKCILEIRSLEF